MAHIGSLAYATPNDEPVFHHQADEPKISRGVTKWNDLPKPPQFRFDIGFGWVSLVVDPDMEQGYGGGFNFLWGLHQRWGAEAAVAVGINAYKGRLGDFGTLFFAGNVTGGTFFQVTKPGRPLSLTIDAGTGGYIIVPALQPIIWTLGFYGGATLSYRIGKWFGVGIRMRYHLFNFVNFTGSPLVDLVGFEKVGIIDRFDLPAFVGFYF